MNRLNHLRQTLIQNIEDNLSYKNVEFVLLDYNSSDGLEDWAKRDLQKYIDLGVLHYYRTDEPESFHRSHSRNIAMKLGTGEILCNLDADNFLGKDFAFFINYQFSYNSQIFLTSGLRDGSYGRLCVRRNDFLKTKGYDEVMSGWGYEDDDLYGRLSNLKLKRVEFFDDTFAQIIEHEIEESILNDKEVAKVDTIYVCQLEFKKSILLYLMKDGAFKYGAVTRLSDYSEIELTDVWQSGIVSENNNELRLQFSKGATLTLSKEANEFLTNSEGERFKLVKNTLLKNSVLRMLTSLQNKVLFDQKPKDTIASNHAAWGAASLQHNFSTKLSI